MAIETGIARVTENKINELLKPKQADMLRLVGRDNLIRETSFAIQAVNANSYLAKATHESIAKCVWNNTLVGLTLNPVMKMACITPRSNNGVVEAVYTPQYQGLVKLITDTGSVKSVYAHPVYNDEEFTVEYGSERTLIHKPKFSKHTNADIIAFYAVGILHDGSKEFEVMSIDEVNDIRARSDAYRAWKDGKTKSCIWETDYSEMGRKTVIKRLCKYLPKSLKNEKWERVMNAIDLDNKEYPMSIGQEEYINSLLQTSAYDDMQRGFILSKVENGISSGEADKIIEDLKLNQLDPIASGNNYNQGDISKKINKEIPNRQVEEIQFEQQSNQTI